MNRFRLFRSRAFWLGLPGLVGLLWGWWVSMESISSVAVGQERNWWIARSTGEVFVSWNSGGLPDDLNPLVKHFKASREESIEWRQMLEYTDEMFPSSVRVGIPYYRIVLVYLALWAGLLIWRKRKFEKTVVE